MNTGNAIKSLRKNKGMTQSELCEKAGLTQAYLSNIESGKKKPTEKTLNKIIEVLEVPKPIVAWFAMNESDISEEKREAFKIIKPTVDSLIHQIID